MATTDPILTLDECAQLLRMTPEYLRKSSCPRIRVGQRNVMYDRDVALRWLRSFLDVQPTEDAA